MTTSHVIPRECTLARACTYDRAGFLWSDPAKPGRSLDVRVADLYVLLERAGTELREAATVGQNT
jgi:hypothetical protein